MQHPLSTNVVPAALPSQARSSGKTLAALGWMTLASVLFSVMNLLGRVAAAHVPWPMVAATRASVGVLVAFTVVRARRGHVIVRASRALWMRSLFGTTAMALTFYVLGSPGIALGDAVTIFNLGPIFLAVLAPLVLGERSGVGRLFLALPLAALGVVLVAKPPALFGGHAPTDPKLLGAALAAAFFTSVAMLGLRKVGPRESAESIALHFSMTAAVVLWAIAARVFTIPSARDLASMIGAGTCAGVAQIAMTRAYTIERAALVASYGYLAVVVSALLGAVALGERPDAQALVGMTLVVASGLVVTLAGLREERDAARRSDPSLTELTPP